MPLWAIALILVFTSGLFSAVITEGIKRLYLAYLNHTPEDDKEHWLFNWALRTLSVVLGLGVGFLSMLVSVPALVAIPCGLVGGVFCTLIYAKVRQYIKNIKLPKLPTETSDQDEE